MKEKLSRFALSLMLALALYAAFLPTASADDLTESLHVAVDGTGAYLFSISGEISEGDEYISADNILYRIATVQNGNAIAEKIGEEAMPDVSWLEVGEAQPVFASEIAVPAANTKSDDSRKLIAMYVTHSDESYVPSDGTQSVNGQGGIYDVARNFRDALQQQGIDVILDESTHLPHDSGAYRRRLPNAFCRKGRTRLSTFIATAFPIKTNTHAASTAKTRRGFACWWDAPIRTARSTGNSPSRSKPWQTNNIPVW